MSRVLITGSSDGLGLMAGRLLAADGHSVTLHARNRGRADDTRAALPQADGVLVGDLSSIAGMRRVAAQANASGRFDAVINNAGIGYREVRRVETDDGLAQVFAVNVLITSDHANRTPPPATSRSRTNCSATAPNWPTRSRPGEGNRPRAGHRGGRSPIRPAGSGGTQRHRAPRPSGPTRACPGSVAGAGGWSVRPEK